MNKSSLFSGFNRSERMARIMSLLLMAGLVASCSGGDSPQQSPSESPPADEVQSPVNAPEETAPVNAPEETAPANASEAAPDNGDSSSPFAQAEDSPQIETPEASAPNEASEENVSAAENVPPVESASPSEAIGPDETLVGGVAIYAGERPRRTVIKMDADPACQKIHAGKKVGSEGVIVSRTGRIANVFVYVKAGLPSRKHAAPDSAAELDQRGCVYKPHVQGIMVGQTLNIRNSDRTLHNINCQAKVNPVFNFGQPTPSVRERIFRKPEAAIKFKCDVHPWMNAWLFVMDHPYFAVTGRDGSFSIPDLPPGDYTLAAWHEKFGELEAPISITRGQATTANFGFVVPW